MWYVWPVISMYTQESWLSKSEHAIAMLSSSSVLQLQHYLSLFIQRNVNITIAATRDHKQCVAFMNKASVLKLELCQLCGLYASELFGIGDFSPGKAGILSCSREPGLFLHVWPFCQLFGQSAGGLKMPTKTSPSERRTSGQLDPWHSAYNCRKFCFFCTLLLLKAKEKAQKYIASQSNVKKQASWDEWQRPNRICNMPRLLWNKAALDTNPSQGSLGSVVHVRSLACWLVALPETEQWKEVKSAVCVPCSSAILSTHLLHGKILLESRADLDVLWKTAFEAGFVVCYCTLSFGGLNLSSGYCFHCVRVESCDTDNERWLELIMIVTVVDVSCTCTGTRCKSATVGLKMRFLFLILSLTQDGGVHKCPDLLSVCKLLIDTL